MKKLLLGLLLSAALASPALSQATNGRVTTAAPTYADSTTAPLSLTTGGGLRVHDGGGSLSIDDAAGSITVDGTVTVTDGAGALNTIVDSGTLTAVTTITNAVTVTDGAGALNTIIDSGSVTVSATDLDVQIGGSDSLTIGTFPDNEPVNVAQMNGVAVTMGNGVAGTGVQRVAIASDNTAVAGIGVSATGAALSANAVAMGTRADGGLAAGTAATTVPISCTDSVPIDGAASGNTELVALTASETIYVCGYSVMAAGTVEFQLIYGTGTACATGETNLTGNYNFVAQAGIVDGDSFYRGMKTAVSNALCYELSAAVAVDGVVYYTKF